MKVCRQKLHVEIKIVTKQDSSYVYQKLNMHLFVTFFLPMSLSNQRHGVSYRNNGRIDPNPTLTLSPTKTRYPKKTRLLSLYKLKVQS